jgi:predicted secreted hydrolase
MENWQSEFLQFTTFILATVWLVQRGSNESKRLEHAGRESKQRQRIGDAATAQSPRWARFDDWRTRVYENSLLAAMGLVFLAT